MTQQATHRILSLSVQTCFSLWLPFPYNKDLKHPIPGQQLILSHHARQCFHGNELTWIKPGIVTGIKDLRQ